MSIATRRRSIWELVGTQLAAVGSIALLWVLFGAGEPEQEPAVEDVEFTLPASRVTNMLGSGDVAIVELVDFECPICAHHAAVTLPRTRRELVDTGIARYVTLNFPLIRIHPHAYQAAKLAVCAGRAGRYWEMHHALFQLNATLTGERLKDTVASMTLSSSVTEACMSDQSVDDELRADATEWVRRGIRQTPTVFLGEVAGNSSINVKRQFSRPPSFEELRDEALTLIRKDNKHAEALRVDVLNSSTHEDTGPPGLRSRDSSRPASRVGNPPAQ